MKKAPRIYELKNLVDGLNENLVEINRRWVPARPLGDYSLKNRIRCAFLAFTGNADVVLWPEAK